MFKQRNVNYYIDIMPFGWGVFANGRFVMGTERATLGETEEILAELKQAHVC